jgi:hypothetical protein
MNRLTVAPMILLGIVPQTAAALLASLNLTALLSNAQTIRNGIIMSEVLNRPESRWE